MRLRTLSLVAIPVAVAIGAYAMWEGKTRTTRVETAAPGQDPKPAAAVRPPQLPWSPMDMAPRPSPSDVPGTTATAPLPGVPEVAAAPNANPAGGPNANPFAAGLADRVTALARQVDSGDRRNAMELFSLLNECAAAPQRMAMTFGCVTGGDCGPSPQRMSGYQDTIAACQDVPQDLIARRQQYLDQAAAQGDARAQQLRTQQPR